MMTTTDVDNESRTGTTSRLSDATDKVKDTASNVRAKAGDVYSSTRERTSAAYDTARESASRARQSTTESIESNPGIALIGGLAIGALAAALLPKSRKEQELLGSYGKQINDRAKEAAKAAKDAGREKLDELGLNKEAAKQKLSEVAKQAGEAVKTSATAAAQAAKSGQSTGQGGQPDPIGQGTSSPTQQGF